MQLHDITLRAPELSDIDTLYRWENDPKIWHVSNTLMPYSRFAIEQYVMSAGLDIYSTKQLRLIIDLNEKDSTFSIGAIDLFDFEPLHKRAGVGILIHENYREKGYASKALELFIDYAFRTLQLHQLYCNVSKDNEVSIRLFQKHNFHIIGLKRDWISANNRWIDEYMMQLINKV